MQIWSHRESVVEPQANRPRVVVGGTVLERWGLARQAVAAREDVRRRPPSTGVPPEHPVGCMPVLPATPPSCPLAIGDGSTPLLRGIPRRSHGSNEAPTRRVSGGSRSATAPLTSSGALVPRSLSRSALPPSSRPLELAPGLGRWKKRDRLRTPLPTCIEVASSWKRQPRRPSIEFVVVVGSPLASGLGCPAGSPGCRPARRLTSEEGAAR